MTQGSHVLMNFLPADISMALGNRAETRAYQSYTHGFRKV